MEQQNRGFSLVELIVVMAVMAILALAVGAGVSNLSNRKARAIVSNLDSHLSYTQSSAMAKSCAYMKLYVEDGSYYVEDAAGKVTKIGGASDAAVSYTTTEQDMQQQLGEGTELILSYEKSSGAFLPIISRVQREGDGVRFEYRTSPGSGGTLRDVYCKTIVVSNGNYSQTIVLHPKTGKHEVMD